MQHPTSTDIQRVREFLLDLQARICAGLEQQEKLVVGQQNLSLMIGSALKAVAAIHVYCKMVQ